MEKLSDRWARGSQVQLCDQVQMWPTPTVHGDTNKPVPGTKSGMGLRTAVNLWPTPCARDHMPAHTEEYVAAKWAQGHGMANLNDAVAHTKHWPTPAARDFRSPNDPQGASRLSRPPTSGEQLPNAVGGVLNPDWVELLMGFPPGWTDLPNFGQRQPAGSRAATSSDSSNASKPPGQDQPSPTSVCRSKSPRDTPASPSRGRATRRAQSDEAFLTAALA